MLQKQAAQGKEEQSECVSFLSQRAAADAQYAQTISKQRLGGKHVAELGDLRNTTLAVPAPGAALPIADASGCEEVRAVRSVLGCMMVQCSEKLQRFAADDSLVKELAAAHAGYVSVCEATCSAFGALVTDTLRAHNSCVDGFGAYRSVFDDAVRRAEKHDAVDANGPGERAAEGGRDLWLAECFYRSEVAAFHEKLWQVRPTNGGEQCDGVPGPATAH